jgi:phosphinothricin acetyltransferase
MREVAVAAPALRAAGPDDDTALQRIYAHHVLTGLASFEEIPPKLAEMERRRRAVQDAGLPYLVAESAGRILGFAYAGHYRPRSGYRFTVEDSVYVEPTAMGQGIGRKLLAAVIAAAESAGMRQMIAIIGDSANLPSIRLHERLGFRHAGVFQAVGWKHERWLDSVLMQRALGAGAKSVPGEAIGAVRRGA